MHWQPVGCVLHGNKAKSFNWTLSTCTTLCLIYITEQQVTPRRSNVYVSSQFEFSFFHIGNEYSRISLFLLRCNLCLLCISNLLHSQRRIYWKLVEIIHILLNVGSSLRWFGTNYTERVPILTGVHLRHSVLIHFAVPGRRGKKALRSCVECLES